MATIILATFLAVFTVQDITTNPTIDSPERAMPTRTTQRSTRTARRPGRTPRRVRKVFTTWSKVSGGCGHDHSTDLEAALCAAEFNRKLYQHGDPRRGESRQVYLVRDADQDYTGHHGDGTPGKWVAPPSAF